MMTQNLLIKPTITTPSPQQQPVHLTLNIPAVDQLFPCFKPGDFAILHGSQSLISFATRVCVRAQISKQRGGLASNTVFIDGGDTFRLHKTTHIAQQHGLNPRKVLENIHVSRAYTAYELTSQIMEKLEETIKKHNAKMVIISDIAKPFLDEDIPEEEAQKVYSQVLNYLSSFAKKHQIILITTYMPHNNTKRNTKLKETTITKASIALSFSKTIYTSEIELEKHPTYMLGIADYPTENTTLTDFF
jgi:RecA/RadA recombinase